MEWKFAFTETNPEPSHRIFSVCHEIKHLFANTTHAVTVTDMISLALIYNITVQEEYRDKGEDVDTFHYNQ